MAPISLNACFKCVKYALFVFCLIAWILGLVSFIWGIVARSTGNFGPLETHLPAINAGANILITAGLFIMIVGFLGCCGAIRESQCLLMAFFVSIFLCFTLLMAAGLWAVAWKPKLASKLHGSLEKLVQNYNTGKKPDEVKLMDYIQRKFSCCGVTGEQDYTGKKPISCFRQNDDRSIIPGCYKQILRIGKDNLSTMTGIGISFAVIMISGMVFSLTLCCALREIN